VVLLGLCHTKVIFDPLHPPPQSDIRFIGSPDEHINRFLDLPDASFDRLQVFLDRFNLFSNQRSNLFPHDTAQLVELFVRKHREKIAVFAAGIKREV